MPGVGRALWLPGMVHLLLRNSAPALEVGEQQMVLGTKDGFALYRAAGGEVRAFELQAAGRLAGRCAQGRAEAGRVLLAPFYDLYTQGFDTADLQDAAASPCNSDSMTAMGHEATFPDRFVVVARAAGRSRFDAAVPRG